MPDQMWMVEFLDPHQVSPLFFEIVLVFVVFDSDLDVLC